MRPENEEFAALFKLSGWTQVQAAERFHRSQAVISRWLNDKDPANRAAVDLFKFILASEKPEALRPEALRELAAPEWEQQILRDLRPLHLEDRDRVLKMIRVMVEGLPQRVSCAPPPANENTSSGAGDLDDALEIVSGIPLRRVAADPSSHSRRRRKKT
ncbi:MAG: hypothetical protein KGL39_28395 [Patescibacteria group bacterium]|nr:hypothetical protein [Patescibacteria group bacterium]